MNQAETRSELSLVRAVRAGDPGAVQRFLDAFSATMWSVVVRLEGEGAAGETAFLEVIEGLKADGYARLAAFDGRARLSTYLAIVARDVLADRLARSFVEAPHRAWARFERFFGTDLRRRVAQRFPRNTGISGHEDAYQEVCLKLIEDDYRRIRAYDGHGSFTGYVLTVVERILIDLLRREAPRRRISCSSVVTMRAPEQPSGCPMAIAPPLTLTRSGSALSSSTTATDCAANASLTSSRSTSSSRQPARPSALCMAGTGPIPM